MVQIPGDKPVFRWLHISDFHITGTTNTRDFARYIIDGVASSHDQYERKGLTGILTDHGGVDCIVATGDFFHKGDFSNNASNNVADFIERIYQACRRAGNWEQSEAWNRLCFCPGNHDLDRNVSYFDNARHATSRSSYVESAASTDSAYLSANDHSREVIVQSAFQKFYETMRVDQRNDVKNFGEGQIVCFSPPTTSIFKPSVVFIGLNTALLAGQTEKNQDPAFIVRRGINECLTTTQELLDGHNRDYKRAQKAFEKALHDSMVINGDNIYDYGKLCLPSKGNMEELENYLSNLEIVQRPVVPILFGHHSIDFLNNDAREQLRSFIERHHISLYLCGHRHQLSDAFINTTLYSRIYDANCMEVVAGGLFYDKGRYNQISFSIGTIEWDETNKRYSLTMDYYMCLYANGRAGLTIGNWLHGQSKWSPNYAIPSSTQQPPSFHGREESMLETQAVIKKEAKQRDEKREIPPEAHTKEVPLPDSSADPLNINVLLGKNL
ncbi:MAG: metallophosphoesterase [Oscillospiraceae bacterium]|nr:metallophosphoesterase [Oscillospiraceae bacterium]